MGLNWDKPRTGGSSRTMLDVFVRVAKSTNQANVTFYNESEKSVLGIYDKIVFARAPGRLYFKGDPDGYALEKHKYSKVARTKDPKVVAFCKANKGRYNLKYDVNHKAYYIEEKKGDK